MIPNPAKYAWTINNNGSEMTLMPGINPAINRMTLKTISFVNAIAWIANKENHHPDLEVSFGTCRVFLTTHDENGVSKKDFQLAYKSLQTYERRDFTGRQRHG